MAFSADVLADVPFLFVNVAFHLPGMRCDNLCPDGKFGAGCEQTCRCEHNGSCDPETGLCQCAPGWAQPNCAQRE